MPTRRHSRSGLLVLVLCCLFGSVPVASASLTTANGIQLAPAESGATSSECPPGLESRQGGFSAEFGADGGAEVSGFKVRGRGWRLLATNTGEQDEFARVESYCSPAAPRRLVQRSTTVTVPPGAAGAAVARCHRGEALLSAGFRNSIERGGPHVVVDGMHRVGPRNLRVSGANLSAVSEGRLTAYAYCGHARRPLVRRQSVDVPPGGKVRLVARCPEKARGFGFRTDVFGGFQAAPADPATGAVSSPAQFRSFGDRIVVTAVNRDLTAARQMTAFVYCRRAPLQRPRVRPRARQNPPIPTAQSAQRHAFALFRGEPEGLPGTFGAVSAALRSRGQGLNPALAQQGRPNRYQPALWAIPGRRTVCLYVTPGDRRPARLACAATKEVVASGLELHYSGDHGGIQHLRSGPGWDRNGRRRG